MVSRLLGYRVWAECGWEKAQVRIKAALGLWGAAPFPGGSEKVKIRISLGIGAPPQTAALLAQAGLRVAQAGADADAELSVSFALAPGAADQREQRTVVQCRGPDGRPRGASIVAGDGTQAASFVLSRVSGAETPMLTADGRTYSAISRAIQAAMRHRSLLIEGETGTGKKLLVRLFHAMSGRGVLVLVNGSVADVSRIASSSAEGQDVGTLFLDNVDELSAAEQAAMLGIMRAAAGSRATSKDSMIRYAAATRRPLEQMVRRGGFNPELYRELAGIAVYLPPLRERHADVPVLANYFLSCSGPEFMFSADALEVLTRYPFPGNVRELENLVRRLSIVPLAAGARTIDAADVRNQIMVAARQKAQDPATGWRACVEGAEREIALRTIAACAGDYRAAARRLGMTLAMLRECVAAAEPGRGEPPRY